MYNIVHTINVAHKRVFFVVIPMPQNIHAFCLQQEEEETRAYFKATKIYVYMQLNNNENENCIQHKL